MGSRFLTEQHHKKAKFPSPSPTPHSLDPSFSSNIQPSIVSVCMCARFPPPFFFHPVPNFFLLLLPAELSTRRLRRLRRRHTGGEPAADGRKLSFQGQSGLARLAWIWTEWRASLLLFLPLFSPLLPPAASSLSEAGGLSSSSFSPVGRRRRCRRFPGGFLLSPPPPPFFLSVFLRTKEEERMHAFFALSFSLVERERETSFHLEAPP